MTKEELIKLSRENLRKSKQGSLCECYDEAFIKGYELSKKRIAELEEELKKWKDEWQEQVQKATDEGYARTLQTMQLSKARDLLKRCYDKYGIYDVPLLKALEQFLNSEVEK